MWNYMQIKEKYIRSTPVHGIWANVHSSEDPKRKFMAADYTWMTYGRRTKAMYWEPKRDHSGVYKSRVVVYRRDGSELTIDYNESGYVVDENISYPDVENVAPPRDLARILIGALVAATVLIGVICAWRSCV
jgi:hypothetical protein